MLRYWAKGRIIYYGSQAVAKVYRTNYMQYFGGSDRLVRLLNLGLDREADEREDEEIRLEKRVRNLERRYHELTKELEDAKV